MDEYKIVGWASYDDDYYTKAVPNDKAMEMVNAVALQIAEKGYCFSGQTHQNSPTGMPVFADGTSFRASMRCWGSIMALIYSSEETEYGYMDFYMYSALEENLPEYEEIEVTPYPEETGAFPTAIAEDMQLIKECLSLDMPLMTTDKAIRWMYDFFTELAKEQAEDGEE